ncbi:hypothetical protein J6590_051614 [Homalodisca vitripennis]|nr:hypothetical protein J6590_051614 [Homalodisca vitripennis]
MPSYRHENFMEKPQEQVEDFGTGLVHNGVVYGMFSGTGALFCSEYSSPALLADVKAGAAWFRKITGAK